MGIYWCAVDTQAKKKIEPMGAIKSPGFFHPYSAFPGMVVMMNSRGYNFEIVNDSGSDDTYYDESNVDVTEEVYKQYLEYFPWAKDEIYEAKDE